MLDVDLVRLDAGLPFPGRAHPDDAGVDLTAAEGVDLAPGARALVGTGVAIGLPAGYAAFVHPRSGLAAREGLGLLNAPGTVDAGYRGEIRVCLINHDPERTIRVRRGDRIAQLVVQRVETPRFRVRDAVSELAPSERGTGGFGSTGIRADGSDGSDGTRDHGQDGAPATRAGGEPREDAW